MKDKRGHTNTREREREKNSVGDIIEICGKYVVKLKEYKQIFVFWHGGESSEYVAPTDEDICEIFRYISTIIRELIWRARKRN